MGGAREGGREKVGVLEMEMEMEIVEKSLRSADRGELRSKPLLQQ